MVIGVNIMAQGLCTLDPSPSPTHLATRRDRATTTYYTHHQVSLMVSRSTTLAFFLGLRIGPACEADLIAGMRREHVPSQRRKKERHISPMVKPKTGPTRLGPAQLGHIKIAIVITAVDFDQFSLCTTGTMIIYDRLSL